MERIAKAPVGYSIRQLLVLAGGREAVAKACGITRLQWAVVPDKHVLTLAKMTNLPIHTIRPDFPVDASVPVVAA